MVQLYLAYHHLHCLGHKGGDFGLETIKKASKTMFRGPFKVKTYLTLKQLTIDRLLLLSLSQLHQQSHPYRPF